MGYTEACAEVAELAYAQRSERCGLRPFRVQLPASAPLLFISFGHLGVLPRLFPKFGFAGAPGEFGSPKSCHPSTNSMMKTSFSDKICLVTGASGFIGNHLTKRLVEEGARVRVLVRKTSNTTFLDTLPVEKYVGDTSDIPSLQKALEGVEYLFHLAGVVALKASDASELRRVNVLGVRNVLGIAQDTRVKRVVFTSSVAAIGGGLDQRPGDETSPWDPETPHTAYSLSKHDG